MSILFLMKCNHPPNPLPQTNYSPNEMKYML